MAPGRRSVLPQSARAVRALLEDLGRAGVTHLPRVRAAAEAVVAPPNPGAEARPPRVDPASAPGKPRGAVAAAPAGGSPLFAAAPPVPASSPGRADRAVSLKLLAHEVAACLRCSHLAAARTQTVFGVGNPQARLAFFGEAPGADEDAQGEPFVGRAGQLLTRIIEACTLRREDVYILNTIKCRPPGNRNPLPEEVANCREYFERQLEIIRPEFICCLGAVAAQALLDTTASIGRLRGRFYQYGPSQVLCTYHPAYLLRNPAAKKDVWEDMQLLMARMGIALPGG